MVGCFSCIGGGSKKKKRKDQSDTDTETENVSDSTKVEKHDKVKTEKAPIIGETSGSKDPDEKKNANEEKNVGPSGSKDPDEKNNVNEEKNVGPSGSKDPDEKKNANEKIVGPSGSKEPDEKNNVNEEKTVEASVLKESDEKSSIPHVNNARMFTYEQLVNATDNFKSRYLLGQGGFGKVYKGKFEDSDQIVAIKMFDPTGAQGIREFVVEVVTLSMVDHPNLVKLIGYCAEKEHRLLVYEYMALGSLENHLRGYQAIKKRLDWNTRINIAAGAARGLEYLHDKMKPPVIYRDLKSSNVLLGEDYHAKLSDFGLAKVGPLGGKTHVSTRVMGTYGYCAPEYAMTGKLTFKSDIYSFGVLLLELLTGRKPVDLTKDPSEQNIVTWARPLFKHKNKFPAMADPALKGEYPNRGLYQAVAIAAMCILEDTTLRPSIGDVVTALDYLASQPYDPSADPGQSSSSSRGKGPVDEKQKKPEV